MQCFVVKEGQRCTHDSDNSIMPGLFIPVVRPDAKGWICPDCIYDMYQAITMQDLKPVTRTPEQVRREMGL